MKIKLMILLPLMLAAQGMPNLSGYLETEADMLAFPDVNRWLSWQKLRLDLEKDGEIAAFSAGLVYRQYPGMENWLLDDLVHEDYIPGPYRGMIPIPWEDTLYVDRLTLEIHGGPADITIGKQQISPGCGYAWNPLDIINVKDVMDPGYEQPGVPAVSVFLPVMDRMNITYNGIVKGSVEAMHHLLALKLQVLGSDLTLIGQRTEYPGDLKTLLYRSRSIAGASFETDIFGIGLRTEYARSYFERNSGDGYDEKAEFLVGADYTFENSLLLMAEYFHNGMGWAAEDVDIYAIMDAYSGVTHSLNRNYLLLMAAYPLSDLSSLSVTAIGNIDDGSFMVNPQIDRSLSGDLDLQVMAMLPAGKEKSELGWQEWGLRGRLTFWF